MLEVILLWQLCKKIGLVMERKGRASFWFKAMVVAMWFGCEILGAIAGVLVTGTVGGAAYLFAIAGAAGGAFAAFAIANAAAPGPSFSQRTGGFPVVQATPVEESAPPN